ncbi:MAG: hypothetical protein ACI4TH_08935, partial [Candidatus Ornithomonoglobus sp.]
GLNIMSPDSNEEFGSSTIVKRGEFALYAARLMNYNIVPNKTGAKGYFDDVDISTEEGAAIQMLAEMGVISIADEFNPNEGITYVAAIKILLCCAGYETAANQNGGYPNGYVKLAAENELSKNLSKANDAALTKTETATLLYNTLFIYPMELNNRDYTKGSETILEKIYDAYEVTGVVTGYGDASLLNKSMGDTQVSIDSTVYESITPDIKNYIGYKVKAYYTDVRGDGAKIIAFTEQSNQNTVTSFDIDDYDEVSGSNIKYYPNGGTTTKSVKFSNTVTVLYNDRYKTTANSNDLKTLLNSVVDGDVTLIANDGTSTANVIIINEYKHLLIERIDTRNYRLYTQNGTKENGLGECITTDPDDIDVSVYMGDTEVSFNDIQINDAVTMKESLDGENVSLYISRNVVTGTIGTISDDEVIIDGVTYDISKYVDREYTSGTSGTFALTTDGKFLGIVAVGSSGSLRDYAYVLNVYSDNGPEIATLKLYTVGGEVVKYDCASNVSINKVKKNYLQVEQTVSIGELITYTLNSKGEIATINRPYDASSRYIYTDEDGSLKYYVNDTDFVKNWNKTSVKYTDGIMGLTFITDNTIIFAMPRFDEGDESDYRILTKTDLENRTYSDVTCYDIDRQGRAGAIVIVEDKSDSVSMSGPLFFISKIYDAVNDEGEEVRRIEGFSSGEEVTIDMDSDTESVTYEDGWMNYSGNETFDTGYTDLHVGDAIQYIKDNSGMVSAYRLVFNNRATAFDKKGKYIEDNEDQYFEDWSQTGSVTKLDFSDNLYIAYGDVQQRFSDYMIILGLPTEDRLRYTSSSSPVSLMDYCRPVNLSSNAYIYVYNVKKDEIEIGDIEDVQKSDVCFVRSKKMGELNEIMVYDN